MRDPDFNNIVIRLTKGGISARLAHRTVNELRDHYDDLVDAAVDSGANSQLARTTATRQLGSGDEIVAEMLSRPELKTWAFRYPRVALLVYPLACLAILPAAPVLAGVAHASVVARWGAILILAGTITATMLLMMQLSILLG